MTDKEARERSGERAMFAKYKHGETGRVYYSFTPSALQFWLTLLLTLGTFFSGMRYVVFLDLRPTVKAWMTEDFKTTIDEHATFAKKSDLENFVRSVDIDRDSQMRRTEEMRSELSYLRARIDAIADKVGAR